jgi:hypothetical protein
MKRINREKLLRAIIIGDRRAIRSAYRKHTTPEERAKIARRKTTRKSRNGNVDAPAKLDIYSAKNHATFVSFLDNLRRSVKRNKKTFISFRNSTRITAAAGLLLVAETDRLVTAFPSAIIRCSFPPITTEGKYRNNQNIVESALNQIGFFKLIGQECNSHTKHRSIEIWRQLSGSTADGSLAGSLLNSLPDEITKASRKKLYRGAIEAIANSVEHAYPTPRNDGIGTMDSRWWMLVGHDASYLTVIICDLGVGIPFTLPKKHPESLISLIKTKFSIFDNSDAELIRASTHIKETRSHLSTSTQLPNRGKGGADFRSVAKAFPTATLIVRSNKGAFFLTGEKAKPLKKSSSRRYVDGTNRAESTLNHSNSIHGTLTEWIVPVQDI